MKKFLSMTVEAWSGRW